MEVRRLLRVKTMKNTAIGLYTVIPVGVSEKFFGCGA